MCSIFNKTLATNEYLVEKPPKKILKGKIHKLLMIKNVKLWWLPNLIFRRRSAGVLGKCRKIPGKKRQVHVFAHFQAFVIFFTTALWDLKVKEICSFSTFRQFLTFDRSPYISNTTFSFLCGSWYWWWVDISGWEQLEPKLIGGCPNAPASFLIISPAYL